MSSNLFSAAALCGLVSIAAVAPAAAQSSAKVLKVVPSADVAELDPTRAANQIGRIYSQMVFDTLYALDQNLSPKPMMVDKESISQDGLTYTFTLRTGLKFQDGSPVTTRDVAASLTHWMNDSSTGGQLRSRLAAMTIVDPLTFTLQLKQRFGLLEFLLAGAGAPIAGIMREADANRAPSVPLTNPIGSGPFRYVASERVVGHRVVFDRNPDYIPRKEPPDGAAGARIVKVDRVEWDIIPDPTTAANAIVTGEADFWDTVTPDMVPFLKQHGINVRRTSSLQSVGWIRPNFEHPPFNDPRARQALALLVDQREFMEAVAGDTPWRTCYSFSVCGSALGTEVGSKEYQKTNVAKAKQLLAEAGYKGEPVVIIGSPQLPISDVMSQLLAQRLRDAGVNVDLQMGDWATIYGRMSTRNLAMGHGGWNLAATYSLGGTSFNPLTSSVLDTSCGPNSTSGIGFPCDPEGESLRAAVLAAPDEASREAAFATFQRHMWQFIPYVPAGQFDQQNAYRKNISGVLGGYVISYWNIQKN
jgi:peptide/nickel transport system substrate-binding protein